MRFRPAVTAAWLTAITAVLLVFGSTVRVHGAGLSCPDWPLCFGQIVPAFDVRVYLEFGHRVLAGLVSIGFVGHIVWLWRRGDFAASRRLSVLFVIAACLLATQIVLGGLTVLKLLAEWTVASHLLTGNLFCVSLFLIARTLRDREIAFERGTIGVGARVIATLFALLVPAQLVLGGLVAGSHAGLACGTWPGCNGPVWFPTFSGLVGLHVIHRIVAYTIATLALINVFAQPAGSRSRRAALVLVLVVFVQATIGIANVLLRLPVEITLLHSAGAATAMLTTAWLVDEAWLAPLASRAHAVAHALEAK